jgi:SAM-dependent methyltransferase
MPTEQELSDYYSRHYRLDYQAASTGPSPRHLARRTVEAEARAANLEGLIRPGARTLDIGCGSGEFVTSMTGRGMESRGIEPGSTYGEYARRLHGDRICVDSWQHTNLEGPFDLVSCFHVLEHLSDPLQALRQFARLTDPDGLVYIEVPNMGALSPNKGIGGFHFAHVVGFNHHSLLFAAALCGLRPRRIISPTGIIFEHGEIGNAEHHREQSRNLTAKLYSNYRPVWNYVRYQVSKLFGAKRPAQEWVPTEGGSGALGSAQNPAALQPGGR